MWAVLGIGWTGPVFPIVAGVSEPLIEQFERINRVTVYDADKVARYPSVVQTLGPLGAASCKLGATLLMQIHNG